MFCCTLVRLTTLSFAYPDVTASDRAGILAPRVPADGIGVFALSTCLRVELAWAGGPELAPSLLGQLYGSAVLPDARIRKDLDAFHYLARVAAGLESAQVGEPEVLSQFRQALQELIGHPSLDADLVRTIETALGVARSARRFLARRHDGSLALAAAALVDSHPDVIVLGGGAMGRAVVRELGSSRASVYSRRPASISGISSHPWEELPEALTSCRAVVSTIPGPVPLFEEVRRSEGNPLIVVDLGMPPALDPADTSAVTYFGIDDVAFSVPMATEPEAEEIVAVESKTAWGRLTVSPDARSIISSVVHLADQAVDAEVRRFANRYSAADEPEEVLRQLAHSVARRIIHPSVSLLGSTPLTQRDLDVMARAFGVEHE